MKITFLGTGTSQGVPVIACNCEVCRSDDPRDRRLRTSLLVEEGDWRVVIDCGPDFRQQMLRAQVRSIDAILVTHGHKDHVGGLDDVRAFNYFNNRPTDVYASREVRGIIRREFSYAFQKNNPYPGVPEIRLISLRNQALDVNGRKVVPIRALHYGDNRFVYGFRIGDLTYITDAISIPEREKQKIRGSRILVLNALRKRKHYSHFNLEEALALMEEFRPEQGFLTHISHQMGLHEAVSAELPGFVSMAYDGLTCSF